MLDKLRDLSLERGIQRDLLGEACVLPGETCVLLGEACVLLGEAPRLAAQPSPQAPRSVSAHPIDHIDHSFDRVSILEFLDPVKAGGSASKISTSFSATL